MKKKSNLILLAVLALAIGYAAVTTTLNLSGITIIGENPDDFDVYFSNAKEKKNDGDAVENKKVIKDDTHIKFTTDMNSIGDTYVLTYDVTNGSKNYDANIIITCTPNGSEDEYLKVTNAFDTTETLKATETRTGTLTVELKKSYVGTETENTMTKEISCTITGSAEERTTKATGTPAEKVEQTWILTDSNDDGKLSVGDEVTLGLESFYVSNTTGDDIQVIAAQNVLIVNSSDQGNIQTGLQGTTSSQSRAKAKMRAAANPYIATIAFDSSENNSSDYETSTIKKYVEAYKEKLTDLGVQVSNIRLITKDDLNALGCSDNSCISAPTWVYSTNYWTSTAYDADNVWSVSSDGSLNYTAVSDNSSFGIRPVVTISKSIVELPEGVIACYLDNPTVNEKGVWKHTDSDCSGKLSIGDLITIENESFYVYDTEGNNVKALAQYNLLVEGGKNVPEGTGTGLQDEATSGKSAIGAVPFDSTTSYTDVYDNSTIKPQYVEPYGEKLNAFGGNINSIALITKDELVALGCDEYNHICDNSPYSWIYSTSYWTSTNEIMPSHTAAAGKGYVWVVKFSSTIATRAVVYQGNFYPRYTNDTEGPGVRPVITISKSLFE